MAKRVHSRAVLPLKPLLLGIAGALLVVASSCAGEEEDEPTVPPAKMRSIVLQPKDLSRVFTRFDEGPVRMADTPPGPRGDLGRFGRQGGWKARYKRPGTHATSGALVVESRVDLFEGSSGAKQEFDAFREELEPAVAGGRGRWIDVDRLGEEAVAATTGGTAANPVRSFTLVWRVGNVTASVTANGFANFRLAHVLELGRKQQRRIDSASAGG
jgi:hypothetical protein